MGSGVMLGVGGNPDGVGVELGSAVEGDILRTGVALPCDSSPPTTTAGVATTGDRPHAWQSRNALHVRLLIHILAVIRVIAGSRIRPSAPLCSGLEYEPLGSLHVCVQAGDQNHALSNGC